MRQAKNMKHVHFYLKIVSPSHAPENNQLINAFHNETSNNPNHHTTLRRNYNNLSNNRNYNSHNEVSQENLDLSGQVINNENGSNQINASDSTLNRNFENQIDEIYYNLTSLITQEKYLLVF